MKATAALSVALLGSAALSFFVGTLLSQDKGTQPQCASVAISFALKTGDSFQQSVSDLTLELQPMASTGWIFSLVDTKDRDFIYPVNPALGFNGSSDARRWLRCHRKAIFELRARTSFFVERFGIRRVLALCRT